MSDAQQFTISLTQQHDYQFLVDFGDGIAELQVDEGAPLGQGDGPSPSRMLAAAVANCLSASLLFSMRKFKNQPEPIKATAAVTMARNEHGRLRIGDIAVAINIGQAAVDIAQLDRILAQFEDFCVVTQSVRAGLLVSVEVTDSTGQRLTAANNATPAV